MKEVIIYTDGACSNNPGAGGWAAVLMYKGLKKTISGGEASTTNNRMELYAVIMALEALILPCNVSLYSDSSYVVNAINNGWLKNWIDRGYRTASGKPVMNRDLWERLLPLLITHKVRFLKVKGHADNEYNNLCDSLARKEVAKIVEKL